MSFTASTVEELSDTDRAILTKEIPANDCLFDLEAAFKKNKSVVFKNDGCEIGALLYSVMERKDGAKLFFIAALAVDYSGGGYVGNDVYLWIENEARQLGCDFLVFDSIRRGMLFHARKYDWTISNIRYQKKL